MTMRQPNNRNAIKHPRENASLSLDPGWMQHRYGIDISSIPASANDGSSVNTSRSTGGH